MTNRITDKDLQAACDRKAYGDRIGAVTLRAGVAA